MGGGEIFRWKKRVEERQKDPFFFFFFTVCTYWFLVGASKICLTSVFFSFPALYHSPNISLYTKKFLHQHGSV